MVCPHAEWGQIFYPWSIDSNVYILLIHSSSYTPSNLSSPAIWAALDHADKNCCPCEAGRGLSICSLVGMTLAPQWPLGLLTAWAVQWLFPCTCSFSCLQHHSVNFPWSNRTKNQSPSRLFSPPHTGQNTLCSCHGHCAWGEKPSLVPFRGESTTPLFSKLFSPDQVS